MRRHTDVCGERDVSNVTYFQQQYLEEVRSSARIRDGARDADVERAKRTRGLVAALFSASHVMQLAHHVCVLGMKRGLLVRASTTGIMYVLDLTFTRVWRNEYLSRLNAAHQRFTSNCTYHRRAPA